MKKMFALLLSFFTFNVLFCQYYYNDIITTRQANKQYAQLKANNVREVSAKSFEADGTPAENFSLEQEIYTAKNYVMTTAFFPSTGNSVSTSFYENDKLSKTIDSSNNVLNTIKYTYMDTILQSITTQTIDTFMNSSSQDVHQWFYSNTQPVKMLLIKDNRDTTVIEFINDEHGNVGEERWKKNGRITEKYFYYYDERQQLTDIVRFNAKAQRLLPDFLFEYDEKGMLTKLTQVPQASADYLVWQYIYNANGLKQKELCFNKQRRLVGSIEYTYR